MNTNSKYKILSAILFPLFIFSLATESFAAGQWRVLVANWRDLAGKDYATGVMVKKSARVQLEKDSNFLAVSETNETLFAADFSSARQEGLSWKADAVVFGNYQVDGSNLVVSAYVYDVLNNQVKMRKVYKGAVTIDIFDTIDEMCADMARMVREALPPLNLESETEVVKLRKVIYKTEVIGSKRYLYSHLGFAGDYGAGLFGFGTFGFTIGIEFIRAEIIMGRLPGLPGWNWLDNRDADMSRAFPKVSLSAFLPGLPLSVGISFYQFRTTILSSNYITLNAPYVGLGAYCSWNPATGLEFSLSMQPALGWSQNNSSGSTVERVEVSCYFFPTFLSASWFITPDFGVRCDFGFCPLNATRYVNNVQAASGIAVPLFIYAGVIYRIDFEGKK